MAARADRPSGFKPSQCKDVLSISRKLGASLEFEGSLQVSKKVNELKDSLGKIRREWKSSKFIDCNLNRKNVFRSDVHKKNFTNMNIDEILRRIYKNT